MLRASAENSNTLHYNATPQSTQPARPKEQSPPARHDHPPAAKHFVQKAFLIGSAMRKALSLSKW
jgi:hypothetical protein